MYINQNSSFTMRDNATVSGNNAESQGGGVFVYTKGTFRMISGTIYGSNADSNSNTGTGAALYVAGDPESAECGFFNGTDWVPTAMLSANTDKTIKVTNGVLAP